ncbi:MAG: FAD-binding protein [Thermodesulfovibrionales bacterium]|nr:FAD-binding protein [Thermodesulfovibrionales bacterium]
MKGLSKLTGIEISADKEVLLCYSFDSSALEGSLPSAVAWPKSTDDVVRIVKFANENNLSVIPRGAGTSTTGASIPLKRESIVVSFEKMKRLLEVDTGNLTVLVEPGIINSRLQEEVEYLGFFYPPDPASLEISTIGGNIATNAGGPRAVKYGVTRDYVMEIEAVLADGSVVMAGSKTHKRAVGYSLKDIFIGSEGTLGVFTKIRLRLLPRPMEILTLLVTFKDLESSGKVVSKIFSSKIIPRAIELMDRFSIEAVERFKPCGLPRDIEALLIIELDGNPNSIRNDAEIIVDVCQKLGADISVAEDTSSKKKIWETRRAISPALYYLKPFKISHDVVVPRNRVSQLLRKIAELSNKSGIPIISFGHAGDGNIHVNIMVDKNNQEEYLIGSNLVKEIFEITISLQGSLSGEHGIGITKAPYIEMEIGKRELELMRGLKNLYDPKGILNPGKIFGA